MAGRRFERAEDGSTLYEQMTRPAPFSEEARRLQCEYSTWLTLALGHLLRELGLDPNDDVLMNQMRRAVYLARREQGHDEGDPDRKGGPPLTERDRARLAAQMVSGAPRPTR